ncbi:MAG: hypothetical protein IKP76_00535 [Bacilli bacterium]|jgi:hypothetical protein|nr:hypothetical protein [Bacilli bacterium]
MYLFRRTYKVNYNNNIFQVLLRNDNKVGFLKITYDEDGNQVFTMPSAFEFINLSRMIKDVK